MTYGPGEVYWQRFGHNAIWLREPGGLDHTFNFGFFDFEQESFLKRFVQGRMLYFAAAVPADREMAFYAEAGREVRIQRLDLPPEAYATLRDHLLWHVAPENREYLYDYYQDNCSTRLRDALNLALGGALETEFSALPATQNFRAHTRRSTQMDRLYFLGLVVALGIPVDREISRWDEMFLPSILADALAGAGAGAGVGAGGTGSARANVPAWHSLVTEDRVLVPGRVLEPPAEPGRTWPVYLLATLLLLGLLAALGRLVRPGMARALATAWLLVAGTLGIGLALVWGFTDHVAAYPNANLFLLNPLWLLALIPTLRQPTAVLLMVGTVLAAVAAAWPGGQYLADTLAVAGPLNLVVALLLLRPVPDAAGTAPAAN